jgi:hypothetical protein
MTRTPCGISVDRTADHRGSPKIPCRIAGSLGVLATRSCRTTSIVATALIIAAMAEHPTDRLAADPASDQLAQRWQCAFQPTPAPPRRIRPSFGPKSSATAMQRNNKVSVGHIGQPDFGKAEFGAVAGDIFALS